MYWLLFVGFTIVNQNTSQTISADLEGGSFSSQEECEKAIPTLETNLIDYLEFKGILDKNWNLNDYTFSCSLDNSGINL